jgi:predicted SAM-dependent methyltransferase
VLTGFTISAPVPQRKHCAGLPRRIEAAAHDRAEIRHAPVRKEGGGDDAKTSFRQHGDGRAVTEAYKTIIRDLYRGILDREPDSGGFEAFVGRLQQGGSLEAIFRAFVSSPEYYAKLYRDLGLTQVDQSSAKFPPSYQAPPTEAGKMYLARRASGFFSRFLSGDVVLDIGYKGYANPDGITTAPHAIGVDLDYPGYDGTRLPFDDHTVDSVFSSHCLEHIEAYKEALRDWHRVLKCGGFMVVIVPSQQLYERKRSLPSLYNTDHKRFYTPASLLSEVQESLEENSYRVRYLEENDKGYDYSILPPLHAVGSYEIVLVLERIGKPRWKLV